MFYNVTLQFPLEAALVDLLLLCNLTKKLHKGIGAGPFKHFNSSFTIYIMKKDKVSKAQNLVFTETYV